MIAKHSPVGKFVAVKGIVFATYYQSLAVALLPGLAREQGERWNDLILCVEMVLSSWHATQCNVMPCNAMQCNVMECNAAMSWNAV